MNLVDFVVKNICVTLFILVSFILKVLYRIIILKAWLAKSNTMMHQGRVESFQASKLHGRELEIKALKTVIERSRSSQTFEHVHVTGPSGVGKGTFIKRVLKSERDCLVSLASFDPSLVSHFSIISTAVSGLLQDVVTRDEQREILKDTLRNKFSSEEKSILGRLLPGNEDIFELRANVQSNSFERNLCAKDVSYPTDLKDVVSRAKVTLRKLIRTLAQISTLIICLQDIDFADNDAIEMIKFLFEDRKLFQTVFIVTYDEKKLSRNVLVSDWNGNANWTSTKIKILGLEFHALNECLADVLRLEENETSPLTKLVLSRTNGNMHIVFQLLEYWKNQGWLSFAYTYLQFKWTWDLAKLLCTPLTEDVAEMVSSRIYRAPQNVLRILKLAASLGRKFDVPTLQIVQDAIPGGMNNDIESIVNDCVENRLLERLPDGRYIFFHEKIRQDILSYIPHGDEMANIHLRIGLNLRDRLLSNGIGCDDLIFKCVEQLSLGYRLIKDELIIEGIASLNKRAGDKAVELSAFSAASQYYQDGIKVLEDLGNKWNLYRELCTNLFVSLIDVFYFTGNFDQCIALIDELLFHKPTEASVMRVSLVRLTILKDSSKLKEFLETSMILLQELGIFLPKKPKLFRAQFELQRTMKIVNRLSDDAILQQPLLQDSLQIIAINVLNMMVIPLETMQMQNLATIACCRAIKLCMKYGNCRFSAETIAIFGVFIIASRGWLVDGYRLGELALKVAKVVDTHKLNVGVNNFVHVMTKPWQRIPMALCINPMLSGYVAAIKQGDPYNAYLAINHYFALCFYSSLHLQSLLEDVKHFSAEMLEYGQKMNFLQILPIWQCVLNLTGQSNNPIDVEHGEGRDRQHEIGNENRVGEQACWSYSMQIAVYLNEFGMANTMASRLKPIDIGFAKSHILYPARIFFFAILAIQNARSATKAKRKYFVEARQYIRKMKGWVKNQAANFLHKLLLLEAEYMSLMETTRNLDFTNVLSRKYDAAIMIARKSGYVQDAALAAQLAGEALSKNNPAVSSSYRLLAFELWDMWGAHAVTKRMMQRDPAFFSQDHLDQISSGNPRQDASRSRYDRRISDIVKRKLST
jgi:predicted ATPase